MKRQMVLGILFAAGALTLTVNALQQPQAGASGQPAPRVVEVDKLKDNLFMMQGRRRQHAPSSSPPPASSSSTPRTRAGASRSSTRSRTVTDKPMTTIINTHTHGDHVSGNVEFPATVDVVVAGEHREEHGGDASADGHHASSGAPANIFKENNGRGMPKRTFKDKMTIGKGADRDRSLLLRPRPHQRRRVGGVPGAARDARRRHLLGQEHAAPRRQQRRQRRRDRQHAGQGRDSR